jgi:hypothetical protein
MSGLCVLVATACGDSSPPGVADGGRTDSGERGDPSDGGDVGRTDSGEPDPPEGGDGLEFALMPLQLLSPHADGAEGMGAGSGLDAQNRIFKAYPGIEYAIPIVAVGGAPPAAYATVTCTSGCAAGLTVERYTTAAGAAMGIPHDAWQVRWPSPDTTRTPTIEYCDRNGNCVSQTWTITVTTSGFKFVDDSAASNGSGTLESPYSAPSGALANAEIGCEATEILYFRAGTYTLDQADPETGDGAFSADHWEAGATCVIWLAYPGETVTIDGGYDEDGADVAMVAFNFETNGTPPYVAGIRFQDFKDKVVYLGAGNGGYEFGFWQNSFINVGPGTAGNNSAGVTFPQNYAGTARSRGFFVSNTFDEFDALPFMKYYTVDYVADHHNYFETTTNGNEGVAYKSDIGFISHVGNANASDTEVMMVCGNQHQQVDRAFTGEIAFNNYRRTDATEQYVLWLNQDGMSSNVNVFNNTLRGRVFVTNADDGDGPFDFHRNVKNNSQSGETPFAYVHAPSATDTTVVTQTDELNDASLDSAGNLMGTDLTNHGPAAAAENRRGHMIR